MIAYKILSPKTAFEYPRFGESPAETLARWLTEQSKDGLRLVSIDSVRDLYVFVETE